MKIDNANNNIDDKGKDVMFAVINFLNSQNVIYNLIYHEPTPKSLDAARVRNMKIQEGIKAIVVQGSRTKKIYMFCLPGNKKINNKKVRQIIKEDFSFANTKDIYRLYGFIQGGIPPLGYIWEIPTYLDISVLNNAQCSFNAGLQTASIIMRISELQKILKFFDLENFSFESN
ncbi:MAG: hypothetical protein NZZ41_05020 [Candidatus Dojkabacteria bacterium]|nr:hypothetical protein [Candidatus Dojkabacteria bacterium]